MRLIGLSGSLLFHWLNRGWYFFSVYITNIACNTIITYIRIFPWRFVIIQWSDTTNWKQIVSDVNTNYVYLDIVSGNRTFSIFVRLNQQPWTLSLLEYVNCRYWNTHNHSIYMEILGSSIFYFILENAWPVLNADLKHYSKCGVPRHTAFQQLNLYYCSLDFCDLL